MTSRDRNMKSYANDFFEKHPYADSSKVGSERLPCVCRAHVYGGKKCCSVESKRCYTCWNEPLPDKNNNQLNES